MSGPPRTNALHNVRLLLPLLALVLGAILPVAAGAETREPTTVLRRPAGQSGPTVADLASEPTFPTTNSTAEMGTAALEWKWSGGTWTNQIGTNCSILGQPYQETMIMAQVMQLHTTDFSHPYVGEPWYGGIYAGVTGNPCGLGFADIGTNVFLPPNTTLAIDANNPVTCWGLPASGGDWQNLTNATWTSPLDGSTGPYCKTNPTQNADGSWNFGYRLIGRGQQFRIHFPMRSTKELKGMAGPNGGDKLRAFISTAVANDATAEMFVGVVSNTNQPVFNHPTPSTTNITNSTARGKGDITHFYRAGNAFFDIGTSTNYQWSSNAIPLEGIYEYYQGLQADWGNLEPGTTYHWRLRFVTSTGQVYAGPDRTFTTTGETVAPTISIGNTGKAEGNTGVSNATFTLTLSRPSAKEIRVNYTTANRTAIAGQDYTATTGTAVIAAGQTTTSIAVPIRGDVLDETNETFAVDLSSPVNVTIADGQGLGTITDDDLPPAIVISNVRVTEGNRAVTAKFTVSLSQVSGQTVKVTFATANGSAVAGSDYTAKTETLTFTPGTKTKQIAITVNGDRVRERAETFKVNLTKPVKATIADAQGIGTINNDD